MSRIPKQTAADRPVDEIVGCNVRGRLEEIISNLDRRNFGIAKSEAKDLLKFFPEKPKVKTAAHLLNEVQVLLADHKFTGNTPAVRRRQRTEQTIALAVAIALLDAGFLLGVQDGEELTLKHSRDIKAVQKALFTTDEDYLFVYVDADQDDPLNVEQDERPDYWVKFVYGNDGWDVISDYAGADTLDKYLGDGTAIQQLLDRAEEGNI